MNNLPTPCGSQANDSQAVDMMNENTDSAENDSSVFMKMLLAQQQRMNKPDDDDSGD